MSPIEQPARALERAREREIAHDAQELRRAALTHRGARAITRGPDRHSMVSPRTTAGIFEDVQSGTAVGSSDSYTQNMQTDHVKAALIGAWILTVGILGYVVGATSYVGWTVLAATALTPPVVLTRLWSAPAPSISETIRDVLR